MGRLGLYLRCLDLYFGRPGLYLGVWACIWASGLIFGLSPPSTHTTTHGHDSHPIGWEAPPGRLPWGDSSGKAPLGRLLWGAPGKLWEALGGSGGLWEAPGGSERLWGPLGGSGRLWEALGSSEGLLEALGASGRLREALGGSGSLWGAQGSSLRETVPNLLYSGQATPANGSRPHKPP